MEDLHPEPRAQPPAVSSTPSSPLSSLLSCPPWSTLWAPDAALRTGSWTWQEGQLPPLNFSTASVGSGICNSITRSCRPWKSQAFSHHWTVATDFPECPCADQHWEHDPYETSRWTCTSCVSKEVRQSLYPIFTFWSLLFDAFKILCILSYYLKASILGRDCRLPHIAKGAPGTHRVKCPAFELLLGVSSFLPLPRQENLERPSPVPKGVWPMSRKHQQAYAIPGARA
jgi:hypothetical protein